MGFGTRACDECIRNCQMHNHKPEERYIFFKLMFGKEYKNLLYLPPEFARTVQHLVDQEIQIEDINGKQWSVTVSKVENSLAFQKGWAEFFEDHDLRHGEFLIFEYDTGSHFWVRILGKSATERKDFNNKMPSQNKRPRRGQERATESEPFQINSVAKPISDASGAVESEFPTRQTNLAVGNADFGGMQQDSVSLKMDELTCMMNRSDWNYYQGEDRNNLNLAIFEMQNITSDPSNYKKGLSTKVDSSGDDAEPTKTMEDDAETGVVCKSPIKGHSGDSFTEKQEKLEKVDQVKAPPVDILKVKSEKAMETEIMPEITMQTINKVAHSSQTAGGHSDGIDTSKLFKKPSENRNTSKGALDDVSSDQNGSSKIAEREYASRFHESPISSSPIKEPFGKHIINIKKEQIELNNEGNGLPQVSFGSEPTVVSKDDSIFSPEVKSETDMSCDIGPSVTISPFLAEVISKSYLELPADFPKIHGKKDKGKGTIVYLQNSIGELCFVLCPEQPEIKALTVNWGTFCDANNIKPGDECRFTQVGIENANAPWAFRVDVVRRRESSRK